MVSSLEKVPKTLALHIATNFFWRHKILNCIRLFLRIGSVEGVIEAAEVFFAESFKGTNLLKGQENLVKEVSRLKREVYLTNKCV